MRLRNVTGSREMIAGSRFVVHDPAAQKGKWHEVFGNDHPIHIEIGMGKGRFMMDLAAANPGIDYVGIENIRRCCCARCRRWRCRSSPT